MGRYGASVKAQTDYSCHLSPVPSPLILRYNCWQTVTFIYKRTCYLIYEQFSYNRKSTQLRQTGDAKYGAEGWYFFEAFPAHHSRTISGFCRFSLPHTLNKPFH